MEKICVLSPAFLIQYVRDNGGFVHPDLRVLTGDEAAHGEVSLAGVPSAELSAVIPDRLAETLDSQGVWCEYCEQLGQVINHKWYAERNCGNGVVPILGAANHENFKSAGKAELIDGMWHLYGTTISYGSSKHWLKKQWGIIE